MADLPVQGAVAPLPLTFTNTVETMKAFAYAGLEDTAAGLSKLHTAAPRKQELLEALGSDQHTIATELRLSGLKKPNNTRFLPLPVPKKPNKKAFFLGFFRPKFIKAAEPHECDLELFLVCKNKKETIGYSFERGRRPDDMHSYAHVQFRRKFRDSDPETDIDDHFVHSYPALPTRCRPPGDTWLSLLVALYGLGPDNTTGLGRMIDQVAQGGMLVHGPQMLARARHLFVQD